jgi:hypothetical protein
VSVFVPCYKYGHYLRGCVESILRQEGVDVRVLILDDSSPDNTPDVARELMREDSRVEYHRNAKNLGHIETYNVGIEWCSGDYCLLLSADDMLTPGALARAARVMDQRPEVVLTYGREIRAAELRFEDAPKPAEYGFRVVSGDEFWAMSSVNAGNLVPTPTAIARTSVQKQVGGYRKDLPHSGDMEMWLRLATHGSVGIIDVPQGFYRTHGQNMSGGYAGLGDLQQKKAAFAAAAERFGDRLGDIACILAHVDRVLAQEVFWVASKRFDAGDIETTRRCLDYALELNPELPNWGPWRRFRLKRLVGPAVWGAVRPLVDWARRRRTVNA